MHLLIGGHKHQCGNYENALNKFSVKSTVLSSTEGLNFEQYDGLILPGGGDITPILFGQSDTVSRTIDTSLDLFQLHLLRNFVHLKKPVLGICKGLQIINIYFGGDIIQHLSTASNHEYQQKDQLHHTFIRTGSFLEQLYGSTVITNSAHHQGIGLLGKDLQIVQITADGVAEGLIHKTLPIYALQWHPERMIDLDMGNEYANGALIFDYFLSKI